MATQIQLRRKHLRFSFDIMGGTPLIDFNGFPAHLSEEIKEWLGSQNIQYSFVYGKAISYSESFSTSFEKPIRKADVRIHFWLEFETPQEAMIFRLTWC